MFVYVVRIDEKKENNELSTCFVYKTSKWKRNELQITGKFCKKISLALLYNYTIFPQIGSISKFMWTWVIGKGLHKYFQILPMFASGYFN